MAKSMVEKYEQILADDPGSMAFVELAKALLDRGDLDQAMAACRRGLEHHPESVVGRVLWGRALISNGKPVEAMEQFDQAIAIERDNPYAYNLIGEVLLHKGLYRSALPILKKAVALQPNDTRIRQWLDQAQRALSGQPGAVQRDMTNVDADRDATQPAVKALTDPGATPGGDGAGLEVTLTEVKQYVPAIGAPASPNDTVSGITDVFKSLAAREAPPPGEGPLPFDVAPGESLATALPGPSFGGSAAPIATPEATPALGLVASAISTPEPRPAMPAPVATPAEFPASANGAASGEVIAGITGVFESLTQRQAREARERGEPLLPAAAPAPQEITAVTQSLPAQMAAEAARIQASPEPAPAAAPAPEAPPASGGLLGELPAVEEPLAPAPVAVAATPPAGPPVLHAAPPAPGAPPPLMRRAVSEPNVQISPELLGPPPMPPRLPRRTGLLGDLPEEAPPPATSGESMPKIEVSQTAAEDIAKEYEKELRQKLLAKPPQSFWRRHFIKLSAVVVGVLCLSVGSAIYVGTRRQNQDNDLIAIRSQAFRALGLDTPYGYRSAIELAAKVVAISANDADAKAAAAYANAALFHDYGHEPGRKAEAQKLLEAGRAKHPGLALAADFYLADDPNAVETAKRPILEATAESLPRGFEGAEPLSIGGAVLFAAAKPEAALARYKLALGADPGHVRSLVALGDYNSAQGETEEALKFYELAKSVSPEHLGALLGLVNGKLALGGEGNDPAPLLAEAKAAFAKADELDHSFAAALKADLDLAEGRVLALQGKRVDAVTMLAAGASAYRPRAADFYAALGSIESMAGNFDKAESAYQKALEARPGDAALKEELARALIARGKFADALKRAEDKTDDRRLRVVRGLARLEQGDLQKAREELVATRRDGKFPAEAVIYLAMVDSASGQKETARTVLEKVAKAPKARAAAHVGLGRLSLGEGKRDEAIAEFTAASRDPRDWEGACSLGRLYLEEGAYAAARKELETAMERNRFHLEGALALGQAALALGDADQAKLRFTQVLAERNDAAALRGMTRAQLAQGDLPGARQSANKAMRADPRHPDNLRLLGQIALASGDAQAALKQLSNAVKQNPRDTDAACELGETEIKVGNPAGGKKVFENVLKADKGNVRARLGLVHAAIPGGARLVLRDSEALVKEAGALDPATSARALALSSRVHLSLNDVKVADARAALAVKTLDGSADAHYAMALVAMKKKDTAPALAELRRAVALDPTVAETHLALAGSLAGAQEFERALGEVEAYLRIAPAGPDAPFAKKLRDGLKKKVTAER